MDDHQLEEWKIKTLLKKLRNAKGSGTSMISLIIPPNDQISIASKMLVTEYGAAENIKCRTNRQSVQSAIISTQQRLKLYNKVPSNGLVIYCGTIISDGKEKMVNIDFEPFKPINTSLYMCDNVFHTEPLDFLIQSNDKFGFIITDGSGTLWGTLCGNTREKIQSISVQLPSKHNKGGQSALRFDRSRIEARENYVKKIAEMTKNIFITDLKVNVKNIIIAGNADFKNKLFESDVLDDRIKNAILKVIDISYGGVNGFYQAIDLSEELLGNLKYTKEKKLIELFFQEIATDSGKYCFGIEETINNLEAGAIDILIIWEQLTLMRCVYKSQDNDVLIKYFPENSDNNVFIDKYEKKYDRIEYIPFIDWIVDNHKHYGTRIEFVTDKSQQALQFCKGFGGIGAILRYRVVNETYDDLDD